MAPNLREAKALTLQSKQRRRSSAESGELLVVRAAAVDAYLAPVETVSVQAVSPLRLVIITAFVGIDVAYHPGSDHCKGQQQRQPERGVERTPSTASLTIQSTAVAAPAGTPRVTSQPATRCSRRRYPRQARPAPRPSRWLQLPLCVLVVMLMCLGFSGTSPHGAAGRGLPSSIDRDQEGGLRLAEPVGLGRRSIRFCDGNQTLCYFPCTVLR